MASPARAVAAAVDGRVRSPVLVGRDAELARAVAVVSAAPSVVVIEGESGIGKTRLVAELGGHPDLQGRRFLVGWCRRLREPFPLGPVLEAVRGLGDALAPASLSPVAGAVRPLLPEIAERLPPQLPPLDDRQAERHRVFRGLVELVGAAGPAVLVLEDLHWADEQTVDFLGYLLGDPPGQLSLVLTFRAEEVAPAVRALTTRLPARMTHGQVVVAPLDPGQTGALAAAILGADRVSAEFASFLCARASGLPFAVEELLALLRARGTLVPQGRRWARRTLDELDVPSVIRDSVLERVSRLSGNGRSVLEAAAVLQVPVVVQVLTATGTVAESPARSGLTEALGSGLLSWQDGRVGFRHVLAMQAVYEDIAPPQRLEMHARAAAAVKSSTPVPLGQLAHHLRNAGRVDSWVDAAERAADQAVELGDHDQAVRLLEDVLRHAPLQTAHRGRLTVTLGWAVAETVRHGDADSMDLFVTALERPQELPPEVRGELRFLQALQLARVGGDPEDRRRALIEAVEDLDSRPELKAFAMVGLATPRVAGLPPAGQALWLGRLIGAIEQADDPSPRLVGKAAMLLSSTGDRRWRALTDEICRGTGTQPGNVGVVNSLTSAASGACYSGHHQTAGQLLDTAMAGAVSLESAIEVIKCRCVQALLNYCRGAWGGLADQGGWLLDELCDDYVYLRGHVDVVNACLALARGETDDAAVQLGELVRSAELDVLPFAMAGLVRLELARGNVDAVIPVLTTSVSGWEAHPLLPPAARALPWVAEAMLTAGRAQDAGELVQRWERLLRGLDAPLAPATVSQARGSLVAADHRWDRAAELFHAAAESYQHLWCPYEAAQAREQAAGCWFVAGDARAEPALRAALAGYQELEASWDIDRAAGLARRQGMSLPARHRGGRRGYGQEISPREREVAELVATGRTNREIARDLYLSTKTVDKHISAALRKLNLRSRAALAHYLAGETSPPDQ